MAELNLQEMEAQLENEARELHTKVALLLAEELKKRGVDLTGLTLLQQAVLITAKEEAVRSLHTGISGVLTLGGR